METLRFGSAVAKSLTSLFWELWLTGKFFVFMEV